MKFISLDINLDMSDPLTLGMGHPVTERIRRLSMRKTNLLSRSGTCAFIIAALGLTAPVFTSAAASPVTEVADSLVGKVVETLDDIAPAPIEKPRVTKMVEATSAAASQSGLKPMRLRMHRQVSASHVAKVEAARHAYASGETSAKAELNRLVAESNKQNRFQLTITEQGQAFVDVSQGGGGWPGFPVTNTNWGQRPLSKEMASALKDMMSRCGAAKSPIYFMADFRGGDIDIVQGNYEVGCVPGGVSVQRKVTSVELAKAYLKSEGLSLEKRQRNFNSRMGFALMEQYVTTTKNATIADDREACIRIHTELKSYPFLADHEGIDILMSKCATSNYNWVRKRHGLSTI